MSQEHLSNRYRVHKFIITPVCSIYNEHGDLIGEKLLKQLPHYVVQELDLKDIAERLESKANDAQVRSQKAQGQ